MPVITGSKYHTQAYNLTTTSDTEIYTVPNSFASHVEHVFVSNNTSGGVSLDMKIYIKDDNQTTTLLDSHSINGKSFESIFTVDKPLYLHAGDKLIFKANTANALAVTVAVEEHYDPARNA